MNTDPQDAGNPHMARAARTARYGAEVAANWLRAREPGARRLGMRFGDWLAAVGWGKFFLLALLTMIIGGILNSMIASRSVVIDATDQDMPVDVRVIINEKGMVITAPDDRTAGVTATPAQPAASSPAPVVPAVPSSPPKTNDVNRNAESQKSKPKPGGSLTLDEKGVRITGDRDGRKVQLIIDDRGMRIEEPAGVSAVPGGSGSASVGASAATGGAEHGDPPVDLPRVEISSAVLNDPDQVEAAVEAARDRIENIVQKQVDRRVAKVRHSYQEEKGGWLFGLVFVMLLAMVIVKIVLGSKRKAESRAQQASATAAEEGLKRQLAEAQLKMMQAQVEPHFLFNTMASVDYLIETDPTRASKMQKNLIQYLRASLPQMREGSTTLGKEVALCRAYLEILKVRMDERLQVALMVPQGLLSAQFPPMMLQTLVENAIKHGLEPKPEGGAITLSADIANGKLRVTVADTGLGLATGTRGAGSGMGVGLANVRERLSALYLGQALLSLEANSPTGTIATVEVPYAIDKGTTTDPGVSQSAGGPTSLSAQPA